MAGRSVHHLARRRHRRADRAGRRPLCAHVRRGDLRWHRWDLGPGRDGAVSGDLRGHRWDLGPGRGGAVRGRARPGGGGARIRVGCGWFGHGVLPLAGGARRSVLGDRVLRSAGTLRRRTGGQRRLAGAQERRRQLPAASARGGRYRAGPVAGTSGCTQAGPPAAALPLLCDAMTSGSARPGPSRAACGPEVAGLHRVTAAARPGSGPGSLDQAPASSAGTRQCERHGHQRS